MTTKKKTAWETLTENEVKVEVDKHPAACLLFLIK